MVDLDVFASDNFDPKAFINDACNRKPDEQVLERFLAELEMRLHLGAEDIGLYLQDQAVAVTQRVPVAARELSRLQDDAAALRGDIAAMTEKLDCNNTQAAVLAQLAELDAVKCRMEAACLTLKEAAGLSNLFSLVDDFFASGDLSRVADALAGIRRGLAVVADTVPEFRDGPQRLKNLEDKLAAAVERPLAGALSGGRAKEAMAFVDMLSGIGRAVHVERVYVAARSPPLHKAWDGYAQGVPFVPWLSTFYDQILRATAAECAWCSSALPGQYPQLVLSLLRSFFSSIDKPARARLAGALTGAAGSVLPLEHLEQAFAAAADFIAGLHGELQDANALVETGSFASDASTGANGVGSAASEEKPHNAAVSLPSLLTAVLAPLEGALDQYPDHELRYLTAEIGKLSDRVKKDAGTTGAQPASLAPGALLMSLTESIEPALSAVSSAAARCARISGGTAFPGLAKAADRALQQHVSALHAVIVANLQRPGSNGGHAPKLATPGSSAAQGQTTAETALPVFVAVQELHKGVRECSDAIKQLADASLRPLLSSNAATQSQSPHGDAGSPVSIPSLRLQSRPALRQQLAAFVNAPSSTTTSSLLPAATAAAAELVKAMDAIVEASLLAPVDAYLVGVSSLPDWQPRPPGSSAVALPSFHPYPLQYITSIGEYLMMLPQTLESALVSGDAATGRHGSVEDEGHAPLTALAPPHNKQGAVEQAGTGVDSGGETAEATIVGDWVDRTALASAKRYENCLRRLSSLSAQGAGQLAADVEYFSNVMSTLGLGVPPTLAAWQAAASAPDAASLNALMEVEGGGADVIEAVRFVGRLRGLLGGR